MNKLLSILILAIISLTISSLVGAYLLETVVLAIGFDFPIIWAHGLILCLFKAFFYDPTIIRASSKGNNKKALELVSYSFIIQPLSLWGMAALTRTALGI
jgi:hypothetical protein